MALDVTPGQRAADEATKSTDADRLRITLGFWVVAMGLATVLMTLGAALVRFSTAADVTTILSAVTGLVGTVVGAFFGINIGAAGKEKAEEQRNKAEDKATAFAAHLQPDQAARILETLR